MIHARLACAAVLAVLVLACGDDDGGASDAGAGVDAGEPDGGDVICVAAGVDRFPRLDRSCTSAADCSVIVRQTDCCGTLRVTAVASSDVARFDEAEARCRAMYPDCECTAQATTADDASIGEGSADVTVECVTRACRTTFSP